jgi:hypothetical protein
MDKKYIEAELIGGELTFLRPRKDRITMEDVFTALVIIGGTIGFAVFLYAVFN